MSSPLTPIAACRQPQNRHACQLEIRSPGLQVATVTDLVSLAREKRPELVVVDIRIPPTRTTEGLDTARVITRSCPTSASWCSPRTSKSAMRWQIGSRGLATSQSVYCPPPHGRPQTEAPRSARRATIQEPPCTLPRPRQLPQRGRPRHPRHAHAVHRPHRLPLHRCTGGRVRHHRPLRRADDARIIAPRATELHALRSAIPTRHTVMMGPWVPPPTSRAPAPCQITSAIPGHIALGVTPNTALSGPQTAERPQPRGWG